MFAALREPCLVLLRTKAHIAEPVGEPMVPGIDWVAAGTDAVAMATAMIHVQFSRHASLLQLDEQRSRLNTAISIIRSDRHKYGWH